MIEKTKLTILDDKYQRNTDCNVCEIHKNKRVNINSENPFIIFNKASLSIFSDGRKNTLKNSDIFVSIECHKNKNISKL